MIFGFTILFFGVLFLLEALIESFVIDYNVIWPMAIIFIAIYNMFKFKRLDAFLSILLFIGLWFLLLNTSVIDSEYSNVFWPIIIILTGVSIIINAFTFKKRVKVVNTDGMLTFHGIFGGADEKVKSKDFKGANIYSIFGGSDIDFTGIDIKDESAVLNVYSIFGGSELKLPENYNIVLNSTAIFGGNENRNTNDFVEKRKTIYINCISIFGGTEIK